jgi:glyoxylase-like metal-dependent hydrolase (beta-lactamase superfamily II)
MKGIAILLTASLVLPACATMQPRGHAVVSRAVQALGGPAALGRVTTITEKGTVRQWEPEQSMRAGGEMRFANEATFESISDVAREATRLDWVRKFVYPTPRTFTFSELVTPAAGYVAGIDSNARTRQSLDSNPPAHTMSGLRLAATRRELRRASPLLLLEMLRHPDRVTAAADATVGGVTHRTVDYRVLDQIFTVMFDPASGLPTRIRTLDYDNIWGDVTYDLVLADWQTLGGVRIARTRTYELNARRVAEVTLSDAALNAPIAPDRLAIPAAFTAAAPKPATGAVPYQWVVRRQFIGTYLDSDVPSYDTRATSGLRLDELAPGVHHVVGGSHHSLLVEMRDHLIVFDAPVSDWHSNWVLGAARARFPGKPVRYLVLTHHHMDHAGGVRGYVAQGATLVVGKGNGAHFRRVLASPFTRNPDLAARDLSRTPIVEVGDRHFISDGAREVHAYRIDNPHADGLLIGYVPEAGLGFSTDIWSPGAAPLPDKLTPDLAALVAGVKKAGITPTRFAGGHGSVADYAPLAALEGR